jgi:hypothetical protein
VKRTVLALAAVAAALSAPPASASFVEYCVEVVVYADGRLPTYRVYDNDGNPGNDVQCDPLPPGAFVGAYAETGAVTGVGGGDTCVTVQHELVPPVPHGVCVPLP